MPADIQILRKTGVAPGTGTNITAINTRANAEDVHSTAGTTNPVRIPSAGTNYSYWVTTRLNANTTPAGTVDNLRWFCYDDKTEILTRDGWRLFREVKVGDDVATRSPEGAFEWQPAEKVWAMPYKGSLLHFKTTTTDLCVTPNHRMLVSMRRHQGARQWFDRPKLVRADWFLETPKSTTQNYLMPTTSQWNCAAPVDVTLKEYEWKDARGIRGRKPVRVRHKKPVSIPIDDWLAFLGLYLAEGWVNRNEFRGNGRTRHTTRVSQSRKSAHWGEMNDLMGRLPLGFRWVEKHESWESNSGQLWAYLRQFGLCDRKFVPKEVKDLPPHKLEILWKWAVMGDGNRCPTGCEYTTTSARLAGDYQEVVQKLGRHASVTLREQSGISVINGKQVRSRRPIYRVHDCVSTHRSLRPPSVVEYDGMVYCVTVPHGVVYVRRNGRPAWCGNTDGANNFGTGVTCKGAKASTGVDAGYRQATGTPGTTGTQLTQANHTGLDEAPADVFTFTSASPKALVGSIANPSTGQFGDHWVYQIEVGTTAVAGATGSESWTFRYDET